MKFYVNYFGCRTNQAEIQDWIIELEDAGYQLTSNFNDADFAILNTCSVTEKADRDVLRFINKAYKSSHIKWIITGCSINKEEKKFRDRYKNYLFITNEDKDKFLATVKEEFPVESNVIYHSAFRSRIFLKVHDGCNFRCSFCIVPFLRGKSKSFSREEILDKARYAVSLGYREIILTGINLSSYGYDLFPRQNLLALIRDLHAIDGLDLIRLSSLDPRYIKYDFVKELHLLHKTADSFHFSFQTGSNAVLKRMNRGGKISDYRRIMEQFRTFFPQANLGADIIFGFPGETEKEYQETLNFLHESTLNYLHTFQFSPREGTKAALMEPVTTGLVKKRAVELKELNKQRKVLYREKFINQPLDGILIDENENYSLIVTRNYLSVRIPPLRGFKKKKVRIIIKRVINDNICEGELEK